MPLNMNDTIELCKQIELTLKPKDKLTKKEVVQLHNSLVEYEPTKMSYYETFESMPKHIQESYYNEYDIVD